MVPPQTDDNGSDGKIGCAVSLVSGGNAVLEPPSKIRQESLEKACRFPHQAVSHTYLVLLHLFQNKFLPLRQ